MQLPKKLAHAAGVDASIHFEHAETDKPWRFADGFFDFALDSYASIDIETREGRTIYRDEMLRTLKPGGYALVTVVAAEDEIEQELIANNPGPEPNSVIWPQNGKFQKNYDEAELRQFYKDFEIVELEKLAKPAFKLGRQYQAVNFRVILKKPS